jgi:hypothetical protein
MGLSGIDTHLYDPLTSPDPALKRENLSHPGDSFLEARFPAKVHFILKLSA